MLIEFELNGKKCKTEADPRMIFPFTIIAEKSESRLKNRAAAPF